jgi:hypothetical protein
VVSMLVPEFAGSNPAEAVGFFQYMKKILRMPSFGGEVKESVPCPNSAALAEVSRACVVRGASGDE